MAEILAFPNFDEDRREILNKLASAICVRLTVLLFDKNILNIPVQKFAKDIMEFMFNDGNLYDDDLITLMINSDSVMETIEIIFLRSLEEHQLIN